MSDSHGNSKRYCIRGHDTEIVGRFPSSRRCRECGRMANKGSLHPLGPRLPFEPLAAAMKRRHMTFNSFGEKEARAIHRYQHRGMTLEAADEWACRIGLHPIEVWGSAWFTFDEEETA